MTRPNSLRAVLDGRRVFGGRAVAKVKLPYYVIRGTRGFWQPNARMLSEGAKCVPCGPDGPEAWRRAQDAYEAWKERREAPERPQARPLAGSLAAALAEYRQTPEWASKAVRTREEWDRCWAIIGPAFGACRPSSVTLADISGFRAFVEKDISLREAHRCIKIWRALWRVAAALKYCVRDADPSLGVRNVEPKTRNGVWTHLEAIKLAKMAWRSNYHGLAALIAVAWDTSMSPVDVRSLTPAQRVDDTFQVQRAKTGQGAIGTLTGPTRKILSAYLARLGVTMTPESPLFRNRSGAPYSKDTLGDDFRDIRALAFGPAEKRTLADFRRSGTVEAVRGGAADSQIASKMANQFDKSAFLRKTYAPVDLASVRAADEARKRGRK
jgi:hypothetical protein